MKINEVAFSAYKVTDVDRARGFYEGVLGLKNDGVHGGPQLLAAPTGDRAASSP